MPKLGKRKCCWIIKEYKKGWRLGFCFGNDDPKYLPFWFDSYEDAESSLNFNCVIIHKSEGKYNA